MDAILLCDVPDLSQGLRWVSDILEISPKCATYQHYPLLMYMDDTKAVVLKLNTFS